VREPTGIYVHVPFCSEKCHYCDFLSAPGSELQMEAYLALLRTEARRYHDRYAAATVFVGGGTPSLLPAPLLARLLDEVVGPFLPRDAAERAALGIPEATVECNPESFSRPKGEVMRERCVNRISLGIQSWDDAELARLGRRHDAARALAAFGEARAAGFASINLDLIYGFPGHAPDRWRDTLARTTSLAPEHVSAYCFILEEGTRFFHAHHAGAIQELDDGIQADMYDECRSLFAAVGYRHYEISNFAHAGRECEHNRRTWRNQSYLGLGLGAVGFLDGRRRGNARTHAGYREQIAGGRLWDWIEEPMPPGERVRESLILGLRMLEGVEPERAVGGPLGEADLARIRGVLDRWTRRGLLARDADRYALTERGLFLSSEVFVDLV
jgi:oxygen-independent coproporphyrinogen-3 oxidase